MHNWYPVNHSGPWKCFNFLSETGQWGYRGIMHTWVVPNMIWTIYVSLPLGTISFFKWMTLSFQFASLFWTLLLQMGQLFVLIHLYRLADKWSQEGRIWCRTYIHQGTQTDICGHCVTSFLYVGTNNITTGIM